MGLGCADAAAAPPGLSPGEIEVFTKDLPVPAIRPSCMSISLGMTAPRFSIVRVSLVSEPNRLEFARSMRDGLLVLAR